MIEFTRGDSFFFKFFRRYPNEEKIMTKSLKMWFTVKENANIKNMFMIFRLKIMELLVQLLLTS